MGRYSLKFLLMGAVLIASAGVGAREVSVGGVPVKIVAPKGFVELTTDRKEIFEMLGGFVPPTNVEYAKFLSEEDLSLIDSGGAPSLERRFSVQIERTQEGSDVTVGRFKRLKEMAGRQLTDLRAIEEKANELQKERMGELGDNLGVDFGFQKSKMEPLPIHVDTDRALSYTMRLSTLMNDENGQPFIYKGVVTTTLVELNGRAVILYSWGGENDLEWSRRESKSWMEELTSINPSRQSEGWFFDQWSERSQGALEGALRGAGIALIAIGISWFVRRRKRSRES